jgi:hypothetical protein
MAERTPPAADHSPRVLDARGADEAAEHDQPLATQGPIGAAGIRKPRRTVQATQCPGGQPAGVLRDAAGVHASQ